MKLEEIKVIKEAKSAEVEKYEDRRAETRNTSDLNTFMRSINRNIRKIAKDDKKRSKAKK